MPEPMTKEESLVLVPGLMCDGTVWQNQIAAFSDTHDVHVPEHALSDSLGEMAQRILDGTTGPLALAGHSMGGRVALEIMARAPERVARLALLDTGYQALTPGEAGERERAGRYRLLGIAQRDGMRAMATEWARGMVHPARLGDKPLMDAIHSMIVRAGIEQFEAQIRALLGRPDRTELLTTLTLPTLVLCGLDDAWSPFARHEEIARLIEGSHLIGVPECGHMSTMERPETITKALADWLDYGRL